MMCHTCQTQYYAAQLCVNEIHHLNGCLRPPETAAFITRCTIRCDCLRTPFPVSSFNDLNSCSPHFMNSCFEICKLMRCYQISIPGENKATPPGVLNLKQLHKQTDKSFQSIKKKKNIRAHVCLRCLTKFRQVCPLGGYSFIFRCHRANGSAGCLSVCLPECTGEGPQGSVAPRCLTVTK